MMRLILILVGLMLLFLCVRNIAVTVAGKKASATVTGVEQVVDASNDVTDHTYKISYAFIAKDGERYTGSYQRTKVFNAATLPSTGSSVGIKYLPAWPTMNMQGDANLLGGVALGALGLLLLVLGVKPRRKKAPAPE